VQRCDNRVGMRLKEAVEVGPGGAARWLDQNPQRSESLERASHSVLREV